ncbi:MAG: type I-C CRISPR-associated protein Cas5 [Candidatus Eremiobacteraeota bacterium]|nr:type I-C CRISPR-associated protein Cas5 [Candidatus Eremiobacteraeota bacterium]MBC5822194.1 type I-C CRISPR-associated protein Cas5 [Candidatus Eremiobacteraeota bacterium]
MTVRIKFWGTLACFTRPDLKVERVSYPVMTPSAARGAVEAIFWRPAVYWVVRQICVLRPIRFTSFRRNEVNDKASRDIELFLADERRAQRNTLALRDVAYFVDVEPRLTERAAPDETAAKFVDMLRRRVERGQCFQQPYLGCREFAASFGPQDGEQPIAETRKLGHMLHDVEFANENRAHFFDALLEGGIVRPPEPSWLGTR